MIRYYMSINDERTVENPLAIYRVVVKRDSERYQAYKDGVGWQTAKGFLRKLADGDPGLHEVSDEQVKAILTARSVNGSKKKRKPRPKTPKPPPEPGGIA